MGDTAYANAVARRDILAAEINRLQQSLDDLRRESSRVEGWLAAWEEFAGGSAAIESGELTPPAVAARKGRYPNPPKEEIAEFARKLAEDRGAPVSRNAVKVALEQEGIILRGTDPDMVLSTMLWRMKDRIIRLQGFGYWPKELDYEPANYKAGSAPELDAEAFDMMVDDVKGRLPDQETSSSD